MDNKDWEELIRLIETMPKSDFEKLIASLDEAPDIPFAIDDNTDE